MRQKIFVTNDDGIESPGLKAAVRAVMDLGEIVIVAPSHQQTAMGRSMRGNKDEALNPVEITIDSRSFPAYHMDCTPGMAVQHGVHVLCPDDKPALLISGINYGENLGNNATQSGTVGAALQGAGMGVPSIAVSLETDEHYHFNYGDVDWCVAEHFLTYFARKVLASQMPFDVQVLKLDVPAKATVDTPWRVTRVARQAYYTGYYESPSVTTKLGEGVLIKEIDNAALAPDSDIRTFIHDGLVSVAPLSLDLTSRTDFDVLKDLLS